MTEGVGSKQNKEGDGGGKICPLSPYLTRRTPLVFSIQHVSLTTNTQENSSTAPLKIPTVHADALSTNPDSG